MGFRRFLLRGIGNVSLEWTLVTLAYNLRRLFPLINADRKTGSPVAGKSISAKFAESSLSARPRKRTAKRAKSDKLLGSAGMCRQPPSQLTKNMRR